MYRENPSDRTVALEYTQPLTEMSTRSISWGKGGRCVRLTTLPPSCDVMQSGNLNFLETSGPLQACNGTALHLYLLNVKLAGISADIEVPGVGQRPVRGEVQSGICERGEITCKTLAMSQMNPVHYRTCCSVANCTATENAIEGIRSTIERHMEKQF